LPIIKNGKKQAVEIKSTYIKSTPAIDAIGTPFQRIDSKLKDGLHYDLQDNSYAGFMTKTGENYGHEANEKLKVTKGRDFRKEKTKFKNKTSFGGLNISCEVRSIPLDVDSD